MITEKNDCLKRFTKYSFEIFERDIPIMSESMAIVSIEKRVYVRNTAAQPGANIIRLINK